MLFQHILLGLGWIVYGVLHSVLASLRVKVSIQNLTGEKFRYYRLFYTLVAAVTLAALLLYQFSIFSPLLFRRSIFSTICGGLLSVGGATLMFVCIKKYFFSLSGLKSLFQEAPAAELMISGIHRYMRHPLYTGTFMAIWGLWVLFPYLSLLIADVVITAYTLLAIGWEEKKLIAEFGAPYRQYQKTVPRLWPRFSLTERNR